MDAKQKFDQQLIDGAYAYAAADKSDPFALRRALTHIRVGLCRIRDDGKPAGYNAEPFTEQRNLQDGQTFSDGTDSYRVTVYRNVARP
jgi:hypothetical protein